MAGKFASVAANTSTRVDETVRMAAQRENSRHPAPKSYRLDLQTLSELDDLRDHFTSTIGGGKRPTAAAVIRYLVHRAKKNIQS